MIFIFIMQIYNYLIIKQVNFLIKTYLNVENNPIIIHVGQNANIQRLSCCKISLQIGKNGENKKNLGEVTTP